MDTLWMFLGGVDTAKVDAERFPSLAVVAKESFAHRNHKLMLTVHELQLAKFHRSDGQGDAEGPERLRLADQEARGYFAAHPRKRPRFTLAQLTAADNAATTRRTH